EDFGLHLSVGLLLTLCLLGVFVTIAQAVEAKRTQFDVSVGLRLAEHREESSALRRVFLIVTDFGSFPMLTGLSLGGGLVLGLAGLRVGSSWLARRSSAWAATRRSGRTLARVRASLGADDD